MNYKVDVPEGTSGAWRVERFAVTEADAAFSALRSLANGGRCSPAGTYTRLLHGRSIVMSDTPDEIRDHLDFIRRAQGRVLIHGLGLGMCLQGVADKPSVEHVTVVELSADVIRLVAPHYSARYCERLTVVQGDAYTWQPPKGARWDAVWHDVWNTLCTSNLPHMHKLHRRFGRRCDWQGSWGRALLEARKRREAREWRWA